MKVIQHYPEVELYWLLNGKGTFPAVKEKKPSELETVKNVELSEESPKTDPANTSVKEKKSITGLNTQDSRIERIVVFFKDGSFKSYEN